MTGLDSAVSAVLDRTWDAVVVTGPTPIDEAAGGPAIVYVNPAFCRMSGYAADEIVGRTPRVLQCGATDRTVLDRIRAALEAWEPVEAEVLNVRSDGTPFWVHLAISPLIDEKGRCTHWIAVQRDVTDRRVAEAEQARSVRALAGQLTSAFGDAPIGMAVTSPAGVFLRVNPALCHLLDRPEADLVGRDMGTVTHPDDRGLLWASSLPAARGEEGPSKVACRLRTARGDYLPAQVTSSWVFDESGRAKHVVVHVQDVTEQVALHEQLSHQALHDGLTGLANRALFLDRLSQALRRDGTPVGVLFVDIDHFKEVNDTLGHQAGDHALGVLADRLTKLLRPADTAARMGGDEFAVLAVDTDLAEAGRIADRLAGAIRVPVEWQGEVVQLSVSVGVVVAEGAETDAGIVLRNADIAMYHAKARGRARSVFFDRAMHEQIVARRRIESDLGKAIELDQLELHYQPVIDLPSGQVQAVEALLRWHHPERGLLLPGSFLAVAEDSDLIVEVDRWVLDAAAAQTRRWLDDDGRQAYGDVASGGVTWVNISARQLAAELVDDLRVAFDRHQLPPGSIGVEITESALMSDLPAVRAILDEVKQLGTRLAIDDFGTGYSSLSYLAELPVDTVKVDQSFVQQLGPGGRGDAVITAVLALADALQMRTIVEGVETATQLRSLRALGVTAVQGYHLGIPAPASPSHPPGRPAHLSG